MLQAQRFVLKRKENTLFLKVAMKKIAVVFLLSQLLSQALGEDSNWSRWRGPNENGSVSTGSPPVEWSLTKNIRWKAELPGKGSSTPIIHGNQVIVLTSIETDKKKAGAESVASTTPPASAPSPTGGDSPRRRGFGAPPPTNFFQFVVMSYDRVTGEKQWSKVVTEEVPHEAGHQTNNMASSSPITDGKHIYVDFGSRGIFCLDMLGNVKWQKDLGEMTTIASFGEGSSATLADNLLVVPWDHEAGSFLVAFNATSGEEVWRTPRAEKTCWATPLIVNHKGRSQVITNGRRVRSYDLKDGKLIWECGGQVSNPIPSPILVGGSVICMTGYQGNAIQSISLDSVGDVTGSNSIRWSNNEAAPYVPTATLYKGSLYFNKGNNNIISCANAETGELLFSQKRLEGLGTIYASPVAVADHIYFTGRDGMTVVVKHGKDLEIVSKNPLEEAIDGSLAVVGDTIYARGERHLFCIGK